MHERKADWGKQLEWCNFSRDILFRSLSVFARDLGRECVLCLPRSHSNERSGAKNAGFLAELFKSFLSIWILRNLVTGNFERCCFTFLQVDAARYRLHETAHQIKEKAAQYGQEAQNYVQSKTDTTAAA